MELSKLLFQNWCLSAYYVYSYCIFPNNNQNNFVNLIRYSVGFLLIEMVIMPKKLKDFELIPYINIK